VRESGCARLKQIIGVGSIIVSGGIAWRRQCRVGGISSGSVIEGIEQITRQNQALASSKIISE
jgi:hypothetical protein